MPQTIEEIPTMEKCRERFDVMLNSVEWSDNFALKNWVQTSLWLFSVNKILNTKGETVWGSFSIRDGDKEVKLLKWDNGEIYKETWEVKENLIINNKVEKLTNPFEIRYELKKIENAINEWKSVKQTVKLEKLKKEIK